jgi:hypothetical protein
MRICNHTTGSQAAPATPYSPSDHRIQVLLSGDPAQDEIEARDGLEHDARRREQPIGQDHHCLPRFNNRDIRARLASDRSSASLRAGFQKGKRQGQPHLSPLPRSRPDRQGPPNPPLARHPLRTPRYENFALSPGPPLPGGVFQNRRVIRFVRCKEVTPFWGMEVNHILKGKKIPLWTNPRWAHV